MPELRFETVRPDGDDALRADWQHVHNRIIPTSPLSLDDIAVRARNHLTVTYHDGTLVGCSTIRPPQDDAPATATVIVRVLPEHRRSGIGGQMYDQALAAAHQLGARTVETVVLASNEDGLRFADRHGYVETDRYVLDGDTIAFVDLRLAATTDTDGRMR